MAERREKKKGEEGEVVVTVSGSEESTTVERVEVFGRKGRAEGGGKGVRRTWVTLVRVVVVEEEVEGGDGKGR